MSNAPGNIPGPSTANLIYVPSGVFFVICPLLVGARLWCRIGTSGKFGSDDYVIIVSLLFALGLSGVMLGACYWGYGQHEANLSHPNLLKTLQLFYVAQILYKVTINLTKISIMLLYVRIFGNVRWFRWVCITMISIVAMYCIASVVATIFQCLPITRSWDKSVAGTCLNNEQFWYANAGFSISTDVIILIMPLPLVWGLNIGTVQKLALMGIFTIGVFDIITSCLRITTINIQATTNDTTFDISSTMWTIIEPNVAIVCASLSQLRPLLVKIFPKLLSGSGSYANRYGGGGASHTGPRSQPTFSKNTLSSPSRADHRDRERGDRDHWTRIDKQDEIHMTTIRKGDASSEEYILQDDRGMSIQKTVGYSVEYSNDGSASNA